MLRWLQCGGDRFAIAREQLAPLGGGYCVVADMQGLAQRFDTVAITCQQQLPEQPLPDVAELR